MISQHHVVSDHSDAQCRNRYVVTQLLKNIVKLSQAYLSYLIFFSLRVKLEEVVSRVWLAIILFVHYYAKNVKILRSCLLIIIILFLAFRMKQVAGVFGLFGLWVFLLFFGFGLVRAPVYTTCVLRGALRFFNKPFLTYKRKSVLLFECYGRFTATIVMNILGGISHHSFTNS
jgi:hypothetical protein